MDRISEVSVNLFGYNRKQVNQLVEHKDEKIKSLESDLANLNQKVQALEEKVVYFQSIEAALKDGLVDARKTGNDIIADSEAEAEKLIKRTNEQVTQYKENFAYYSKELANTGTDLRDQLKMMQSQMLDMISDYEKFVSSTNFDEIFPSKQVERFMDQIEDFEEDDLQPNNHRKNLSAEKQLSDKEKEELQRLIQDVIKNEEKAEKSKDKKLVDFKKAHG
ncbi:DivIVA domain-containing protein [Facklamia sp. 7083-14-GEN3]|uniref:DivIVA domain-containing protein n=1 Tax=Facklamia sp. 7083-14-GEN3 TaxID=2973478 RepID=UPI00215D56BB|nr:DivIVA domain-containing protein [Facklamia sp. 7083-14-GEN3]MCR8969431.1 DivIVA domain-containing protein [Facklamia sp. 7083-14-GEN3]